MHHFLSLRFLKSLIVGGISALVSLAVLALLTEKFGVYYLKSSAVGFCFALVTNFTLQKYWTFDDQEGDIATQFIKTVLLALFNLLFNLGVVYALTEFFGLWYIVSQILAIGSLAILNFTVLRLFVYGVTPRSP